MQKFFLPGIIFDLVKNNFNKTDDIKITKPSEKEKDFQSFVTNTYRKETEVIIKKCKEVEQKSINTSTIYFRGKARKNIDINFDNFQQTNSFSVENVNDRILQETTSNISQSILNSIKSFIETKSKKDFNYSEDVNKKESFISSLLSFCTDLLSEDQKVGEYLNQNPTKNDQLTTFIKSATMNISKSVSQQITSSLFKSTFQNIYNVHIDLESIDDSINVSLTNSQLSESVMKTLEKLDVLGKIFDNISNINGLDIDASLKEINSIHSKEIRKKKISHERITDIFSNIFGIIAISAVVLLAAFFFTFTPSVSTSFDGVRSAKKRVKFKSPVVSQIESIETIDRGLISSAGLALREDNSIEITENTSKNLETSLSKDTLITDVLFNESKFE